MISDRTTTLRLSQSIWARLIGNVDEQSYNHVWLVLQWSPGKLCSPLIAFTDGTAPVLKFDGHGTGENTQGNKAPMVNPIGQFIHILLGMAIQTRYRVPFKDD